MNKKRVILAFDLDNTGTPDLFVLSNNEHNGYYVIELASYVVATTNMRLINEGNVYNLYNNPEIIEEFNRTKDSLKPLGRVVIEYTPTLQWSEMFDKMNKKEDFDMDDSNKIVPVIENGIMKMGIVGQNVSLSISKLLDKHLPADGVGTDREKLRMNLHRDISILINSL